MRKRKKEKRNKENSKKQANTISMKLNNELNW